MGQLYEFAFACDLKPDLSQEVIDTLKYMTRSEDYDFETTLTDDLFTTSWEEGSFEAPKEGDLEDEFIFLWEWRTIISNTPTYGEESLAGLCGSIFSGSKINARKYVGDDEFFNAFHLLMDWLVSICEPSGFIGYYSDVTTETGGDPTLIYFENGRVLEKKVSGEFKELFTYLNSSDEPDF
jgi:hypothetical protein